MTQFEYLAIAFSLLYSLAALRIIGGLSSALSREARSGSHLVLTGTTLFLVAISFWVFYSLSGVEWTFAGFLVALLIPGAIYYCAATVMPSEAEAVASWKHHYLATRRRWFLGLAVWGASAAASASVNLGMELAHPARGVQATAVTVGLIGAWTENEKIHRAIEVLFVILILTSLAAQLQPSWLAER